MDLAVIFGKFLLARPLDGLLGGQHVAGIQLLLSGGFQAGSETLCWDFLIPILALTIPSRPEMTQETVMGGRRQSPEPTGNLDQPL